MFRLFIEKDFESFLAFNEAPIPQIIHFHQIIFKQLNLTHKLVSNMYYRSWLKWTESNDKEVILRNL